LADPSHDAGDWVGTVDAAGLFLRGPHASDNLFRLSITTTSRAKSRHKGTLSGTDRALIVVDRPTSIKKMTSVIGTEAKAPQRGFTSGRKPMLSSKQGDEHAVGVTCGEVDAAPPLLSPASTRLLRAAALLEPPFTLETLEPLSGVSFAAVYEAVAAGILAREPHTPGSYQFCDEPCRQRFLSSIPVAELRSLRELMNPLSKATGVPPEKPQSTPRSGAPNGDGAGLNSAPPGKATADSGSQHHAAVFRKQGEYWAVGSNGSLQHLRNTKGLHYVAYLLRNAGQEVHVLDLVFQVSGPQEMVGIGVDPSAKEVLARGGLDLASANDYVLDERARQDYLRRLSDLRDELASAESLHDLGRVDHLRVEMETLTAELAHAYGLNGRSHNGVTQAERARSAVRKRVKDTVRRVKAGDPVLADHLGKAVKTGMYCVYLPDAASPWTWLL
jgi:hypothetical protein